MNDKERLIWKEDYPSIYAAYRFFVYARYAPVIGAFALVYIVTMGLLASINWIPPVYVLILVLFGVAPFFLALYLRTWSSRKRSFILAYHWYASLVFIPFSLYAFLVFIDMEYSIVFSVSTYSTWGDLIWWQELVKDTIDIYTLPTLFMIFFFLKIVPEVIIKLMTK